MYSNRRNGLAYPLGLSQTSTSLDLQEYETRLTEMSSEIFSREDGDIDISVIDTNDDSVSVKNSFSSTSAFDTLISSSAKPRSRVISLCSQNSTEPLRITENCMRRLLGDHTIGPEFLDILFAIGNKPRESEAGIKRMVTRERLGGMYDTTYMIVYAEKVGEAKPPFWTIRQTGVFHRYDPAARRSLWIIINPMPHSKIHQRLDQAAAGNECRQVSSINWHNLHPLIISSYLGNWRWYLNDLNDDISRSANMALTLNFSSPHDYEDGFRALTKLQHLQDKIIPVPAWLQASLGIVSSLETLYACLDKRTDALVNEHMSLFIELDLFKQEIEGHLLSIDCLKARSQGTLNILSVTLTLKNQVTSVEINDSMLDLTKDTLDDSSTVRVITIVTLIFLPANFIATVFGMNLFSFQTATDSGFQTSNKFWLYFVFAVPLSLIAIGWWYISIERPRSIKAAGKKASQQKKRAEDV